MPPPGIQLPNKRFDILLASSGTTPTNALANTHVPAVSNTPTFEIAALGIKTEHSNSQL